MNRGLREPELFEIQQLYSLQIIFNEAESYTQDIVLQKIENWFKNQCSIYHMNTCTQKGIHPNC